MNRGADGSGDVIMFSATPVKILAHEKGEPFGATARRFT